MNPHISYKTRQVSNVLEFLKEAKVSSPGYESTQIPFFLKNNMKNFDLGYESIPELPEGLNRNIKLMYKIISNPNIEVYIRDWTIMSLKRALEIYNDYKSFLLDIEF